MRTPQQPSYSDGKDPVLEAIAHFRDKQRKQKLRARAEHFSRPEASAEAEALAARGRGSDSEIAHVTPGEIVLHPSMLSPETLAAVVGDLSRCGAGLGRVSVGSSDASVNPRTGLAEYRATGITTWKVDPPRQPDWESRGNQVPTFRPNPSGYNVALPGNAAPRTFLQVRGAGSQAAPDRGWASSGAIGGFPMSDLAPTPDASPDAGSAPNPPAPRTQTGAIDLSNMSKDELRALRDQVRDSARAAEAGALAAGAFALVPVPPVPVVMGASAAGFGFSALTLEHILDKIEKRLEEME